MKNCYPEYKLQSSLLKVANDWNPKPNELMNISNFFPIFFKLNYRKNVKCVKWLNRRCVISKSNYVWNLKKYLSSDEKCELLMIQKYVTWFQVAVSRQTPPASSLFTGSFQLRRLSAGSSSSRNTLILLIKCQIIYSR